MSFFSNRRSNIYILRFRVYIHDFAAISCDQSRGAFLRSSDRTKTTHQRGLYNTSDDGNI